MISITLAKQLRGAGLGWEPVWGDVFHIPERNLDDRVFVIADLSVDVTTLVDGIGAITFNGAVEWSLDYILTQDVVWLPTETQLRDGLGSAFGGLRTTDTGFRCDVHTDDGPLGFEAPTAEDAYGLALLHSLDPRPHTGLT
ncbi:MAG: pilus assembly protein CpaE [Acidimicrobiia bacterium]